MNNERMRRLFGDENNPQTPTNVIVIEDLGDALRVAIINPDDYKGKFSDNQIED